VSSKSSVDLPRSQVFNVLGQLIAKCEANPGILGILRENANLPWYADWQFFAWGRRTG
jgi:hypothetical protein